MTRRLGFPTADHTPAQTPADTHVFALLAESLETRSP